MPSPDRSRLVATLLALVTLAGCNRQPVAPTTPTPGPYVSEQAGAVVIDHPITRKKHYPPGTWSKASPDHERWEFCFDQTNGGWTCVPVSVDDYRRYNVGDRILLRQETGQLAVIAGGH